MQITIKKMVWYSLGKCTNKYQWNIFVISQTLHFTYHTTATIEVLELVWFLSRSHIKIPFLILYDLIYVKFKNQHFWYMIMKLEVVLFEEWRLSAEGQKETEAMEIFHVLIGSTDVDICSNLLNCTPKIYTFHSGNFSPLKYNCNIDLWKYQLSTDAISF